MRYALCLSSLLLIIGARSAHAQSEPAPASAPAAAPTGAVEPASDAAPAPAEQPATPPPPEFAPPPPELAPPPTPIAEEPTVVADASTIAAPPVDDADSDRPAESVYPIFEPRARLIVGAQKLRVHPEGPQVAEDNRQPFFLQQARLALNIEANDMLSGSFSAELDAKPSIRDAYVNVKLARKFQIMAGHFKRPMSRIELTSTGRLPFRDRGLFNQFILRDQDWGNRSLGLMLWGKFKSAHLSWYAAVMNASDTIDVSDSELIRGVDTLGRVEYEPTDWLSIALNGGYKRTELYADGPNLNMFAFGGDLRVHVDGLRVVLESIAAQNAFPPSPPPADGRTPFAANAMAYATYDIGLGHHVIMQPTLVGEWYDSDTEYSGDQTLRGVLGLNFLFFDQRYRVLPQIEIVRPIGDDPQRNLVKAERYYVLLSVQL
jgi:hypothetical protein